MDDAYLGDVTFLRKRTTCDQHASERDKHVINTFLKEKGHAISTLAEVITGVAGHEKKPGGAVQPAPIPYPGLRLPEKILAADRDRETSPILPPSSAMISALPQFGIGGKPTQGPLATSDGAFSPSRTGLGIVNHGRMMRGFRSAVQGRILSLRTRPSGCGGEIASREALHYPSQPNGLAATGCDRWVGE
jgi:hypothetical protein